MLILINVMARITIVFRFSHNKKKCEPIANPRDRPWTARTNRLETAHTLV